MTEVKNQPVPRQELDAAKVSVPSEVPPECLAQWEAAASVSFQQFNEDLKRGVLRLNPECLKFEDDSEINKKIYLADRPTHSGPKRLPFDEFDAAGEQNHRGISIYESGSQEAE
jgi:hypothetical protein